MTDAFISYSRRDKVFVKKLYDAILEHSGRTDDDLWADWDDIPPTADWWKEIQVGIEGASNFVFVISPDSAKSSVCGDEVKHALKNHKRLIPILHRELSGDADAQEKINPTINVHNWIFMREEDSFEDGLAKLLESLATDLEHVNTHTRLLVRAKEWIDRNQDSSLLLRGSDLIEAESWLAANVDKEPRPTQLHTEYISSGRLAETRRQRTLLIGVSFALVVAIGLMILSLFLFRDAESQRGLAEDRREEAEQQRATAVIAQENAEREAATAVAAQATSFAARQTSVKNYLDGQTQQALVRDSLETVEYQNKISNSLALAAQAQLELDGDFPERSVLLALEALNQGEYTIQAENTLGFAIQRSLSRGVISAHNATVSGAFWSPDETRIVTTSWDNTAKVWDAETLELVASFNLHEGSVWGAAWSPDGQQIATVSQDGAIQVWEAETAEIIKTLRGVLGGGNYVAWSPNGLYLLVANLDGTAHIWDMTALSDAPVLVLAGHEGSVWKAIWSPDGSLIATAGADTTVKIWQFVEPDGQIITEPLAVLEGHTDSVWDASWSPDGTKFATVSNNAFVYLWDATQFFPDEDDKTSSKISPINRLTYPQRQSRPIFTARWSPDSRLLAMGGPGNLVQIWDSIRDDEVLGIQIRLDRTGTATIPTDGVRSVDWSMSQKRLLTAGADGQVELWDVGSIFVTGDELIVFNAHQTTITDINWSHAGDRFLSVSFDNTVRIWDGVSYEMKSEIADSSGTLGAGWSPDDTQIIVANGDGTARIWDVATGELVKSLEGHQSALITAAFSPDGIQALTTSFDNTARIWDVASGEIVFTLEHGTGVNSGAWSPNGRRVATAAADGVLRVWDAQTGELVQEITAHLGSIQSVAWSPNGNMLATAGFDNLGRIWNAASGELISTLSDHTSNVIDVTWAPNNQRVMTTGADGTARLWNTATGGGIYEMTPHDRGVLGIAWSPDGGRVVTGGAGGQIKVWRAFPTTRALIQYAELCCAVRSLTPDELIQFSLDG